MNSKNERDEVEEFLYEEAALLDAWDARKGEFRDLSHEERRNHVFPRARNL
jgi:3-phenylpropionate/cinnamic acid dioxygenase small subunit